MPHTAAGRWLLLLHQIPPQPVYFRVKVWRRLQRLGAVAVKNSVWVLPWSDDAAEDFRWLLEEIVAGGGDGSLCRAEFLDRRTDRQLAARFRRARAARAPRARAPGARTPPRGATWVTRRRVFVDRIASAWLIRRFIDPRARFRFVAPEGYRPRRGELRFDMFEAEYTHQGDHCTFETLLRRFRIPDAALRPIAQIVHDIDLKDEKYGRRETAGVARRLTRIARGAAGDAERVRRGALVFDALYRAFGAGRRRSRKAK